MTGQLSSDEKLRSGFQDGWQWSAQFYEKIFQRRQHLSYTFPFPGELLQGGCDA